MMNVKDTHPEYQKAAPKWERADDVLDGGDAVKAKGEKYLPRLPGQTDTEYAAYLMRAVFYSASLKTLDLFTGLVFSKSPKIEGVDPESPLLTDADLGGMPFPEELEDALEEVIGLGRYGVLVDFAGKITPDMGRATAEASGARPFMASYEAADILNWTEGSIRSRRVLTGVLLQECYDAGGKEEKQRRALTLGPDGYRSDVYRPVKNKNGQAEGWAIVPDLSTVPEMRGAPLPFIPFFFLNPEYGKPEVSNPPLMDLIDANLSHYRTAADLEHALYHCGLPTPWATGVDEKFSFSLGGTNGLLATNENAKFGYLEYSGQGVAPLEKSLDRKETWMAKLGSALLGDEKAAAETAQTAMIKRTGEAATLASMANAVSAVMTKVLKLMIEWSGGDPAPVSVQLNTEFMPAGISYQEIDSLVKMVQAGDFRRIDLLNLLKVAGKLSPDADTEAIDAELGDSQAGTLALGLKMAQAGKPPAGTPPAPEGAAV